MSTALGIAAVSVVLVDLLNNGLVDHDVGSSVGGRVTVSALPPDRVVPGSGADTTQLNLFLYNTTPNLGWRNAGLPRLDENGQRVSNPPLALNLHYLLTAYGEKDFYAEILLGWAMQILHENPVLSRAQVATALAPAAPETPAGLPDSLEDLSTSGLADQAELIKITPEALSTDDMSRLWTAFQTHYRSAAAYQASVVLIQSTGSTRRALRVRDRNVYADPLQRPVIESVVSSLGDALPILAGDTILIRGRQFAADVVKVRLGGTLIDPAPGDVTDTQISLSLAAHPRPAGPQGIQVVHERPMGTPPQTHRAVESSVATFVLVPELSAPALTGTTLAFDVSPGLVAGQRAVLALNQLLDPGAPDDAVANAYSYELAPVPADTTSLSFDLGAGVAAGTYLLRLQVDGAESPLSLDPATGRYDEPKVVIP